jgi:hypothetical protein
MGGVEAWEPVLNLSGIHTLLPQILNSIYCTKSVKDYTVHILNKLHIKLAVSRDFQGQTLPLAPLIHGLKRF